MASSMLPPLVGRLVADISGFAAGMGEATAIAKAETGASAAAFNGLASIGKAALIGVAGAAIIGGGAAVHMAADFESATTRLITSAGETHENIALVSKGILDMAGQVGDSAQELATAMYMVDSANIHGADSLIVLRAAAEGAKAENADLTTVVNAVTSAMADYHLGADQSALVTSRLITAVSMGKTTFQDLTGAMHSVLPEASAAHISMGDILGDLASMTEHGISADQATQNLAHTIGHLQTTTAPQNKELALLGINARQLSDDLGTKGLSGTLIEISNAIEQHMGPDGHVILEMQQALAGLPPTVQKLGAEVVNGTISLGDFTKAAKGLNVEQAGLAHQFATLMTSTHGIGSAQKSGAELAQSYAAALKAATGDSTTLGVALMLTGENADYTTQAVKTVSGATTEAGGHVKGWSDIQATFNQHLARAQAGLGAVAITVGTALIPYLIRAMDATAGFTNWLAKNQQVSIPLAVAIGGILVVAILAYTVSMAAAAVATIAATWPILLIIAAAALLAVGIYLLVTHWKQVTEAVKVAWTWFLNFLGAARRVIDHIPILGGVLETLIAIVQSVIIVVRFLIDHWHQITSAVGEAFSELGRFGDWLRDTFGPILHDIAGFVGGLAHDIQGLASAASNIPVLGGIGATLGIPGFAEGGTVPGPIGAPRLVLAHGGETVTPPGGSAGSPSMDDTNDLLAQAVDLLAGIHETLQPRAGFSNRAYGPA